MLKARHPSGSRWAAGRVVQGGGLNSSLGEAKLKELGECDRYK